MNCLFDTRQVCGYNLALQTAWYDDGLDGGGKLLLKLLQLNLALMHDWAVGSEVFAAL